VDGLVGEGRDNGFEVRDAGFRLARREQISEAEIDEAENFEAGEHDHDERAAEGLLLSRGVHGFRREVLDHGFILGEWGRQASMAGSCVPSQD